MVRFTTTPPSPSPPIQSPAPLRAPSSAPAAATPSPQGIWLAGDNNEYQVYIPAGYRPLPSGPDRIKRFLKGSTGRQDETPRVITTRAIRPPAAAELDGAARVHLDHLMQQSPMNLSTSSVTVSSARGREFTFEALNPRLGIRAKSTHLLFVSRSGSTIIVLTAESEASAFERFSSEFSTFFNSLKILN